MQRKLFGTSGIRGVVNRELTPEIVVKIGLAVATYTGSGKIAVAYDTRLSSPLIEHSLIAGLQAGGSDVSRLGLIPTPVLAFLTRELRVDTGIMITASHNPPQYNGIKLFNQDSTSYNEKQEKQIEKIIKSNVFERTSWQKVGSVNSLDESGRYLKLIQDSIRLGKEWQVMVDPGCGATSRVVPHLFRILGCKVAAINTQPDGFFPGRSPEPEVGSLEQLCKIVKHLQADLGIAYDGDGDRMVVVDENGMLVPPDQILATYAAYTVQKHKGGVVATNTEASMCIEEMTEPHSGKVIRTKVGDVHIASAMKQHDAIFGGEPCGAWIHPDFHYCPDGILSSLLILKALEETNHETLSSFVSETPLHPTLRRSLVCPEQAKSIVIEKLERTLFTSFHKIHGKDTVDGIRLILDNGWILTRASGTEPLIRITVEADSEEAAEEIMQKGAETVERAIEETGV